MKLLLPLSLLLALSSCSTMPQSAAGDPPEYFAKLNEKDAEAQLAQVNKDIAELEGELRSAESRKDSAQMKEGTDASMSGAVESAEADFESINSRKGQLINRQLQLEKRLRELKGDAAAEY